MPEFGSSGFYIGEEPINKNGEPVIKIRSSKYISFHFFNPFYKIEREIRIRTRDEYGHFKSREQIRADIVSMGQSIGATQNDIRQMIEDFNSIPW